jgi:hypothetical protein
MRNASQITTAAEGRRIIRADAGPDLVAIPIHVAGDALSREEAAVLMRFMDASEMHKGNRTVIILHGEPQGRYARYHERVDPKTYADFEVDAYVWIRKQALGKQLSYIAELVARMNAERGDVNIEALGAAVTNSKDPDIALGGAIATIRAAAWALFDAYRDYYELWKIRDDAARVGRALSDDDAAQRVRRARMVASAVKGYQPALSGRKNGA